MNAKENEPIEVGGQLVSQKVFDEVCRTWPKRGPTEDDRYYQARVANHVLLVAREHGEEPEVVGLERR